MSRRFELGTRGWCLGAGNGGLGTAFVEPRSTHSSLLAPRSFTRGITLVEMLIAMAVTLVMMGAVVTLFANVSNSVRNRRAMIEVSGQLRHARNVLQNDLLGATCQGLTWQRPESNQGYIEIIEGPYREGNASMLIDGQAATAANPEIDHTISSVPTSNLELDDPTWITDGGGLGDFDDILMLTVRNEQEGFTGAAPQIAEDDYMQSSPYLPLADPTVWGRTTIKSPLAEVVWFAVENPTHDTENFLGEPGMRTVYRRVLLIAPWLDPYKNPENGANSKPGVLLDFPDLGEDLTWSQAIAELIAFQEQYDISMRVEQYVSPTSGKTRTRIVANTLGDLTKRENRYEHHSYVLDTGSGVDGRAFPFAVVSTGSGYRSARPDVEFTPARGIQGNQFTGPGKDAGATAQIGNTTDVRRFVSSFTIDPANFMADDRRYESRPFAYVDASSTTPATARAILNDEGEVVHVVAGLVPLWGARRGEDVMLTGVLGFDLRVFDPGAPLYGIPDPVAPNDPAKMTLVLEPSDPGWKYAYDADIQNTDDSIDGTTDYRFVGQGAYVDLGYGFDRVVPDRFFESGRPGTDPWFFEARPLHDVYGQQLAPGYAVYDTWSFHYENDGVNEDGDSVDATTGDWLNDLSGIPQVDEGTNGLDDISWYPDGAIEKRLGTDDVGERETTPPYDKPLRGVQVILRVYEPDSRQIRQVSVNQHFLLE